MGHDIDALLRFYAGPYGHAVCRYLAPRIGALWPNMRGRHILGLGFTPPYLSQFENGAASVLNFMPARMGVVSSSGPLGERSALVHPTSLPVPDESFDHILLVHALEHAPRIQKTLREIWRVLSPGGRILLIVPNRTGLWARSDATPFGHGQPYSRSQIRRLLEENMLTPMATEGALHLTPGQISHSRLSRGVDVLGSYLWPHLCGVLIIEAEKRIYGAELVEGKNQRLAPASAAPSA
jgi:SAM-dependent methyltransferase